MRSGWRFILVVTAGFAAFPCALLRADPPAAEIDSRAREELKDAVANEKFDEADKIVNQWRRVNLQKTWGANPLLDSKADMKDLNREFEEAVDKGQYGVAEYYLDQIRVKSENPPIFKPALDLTIWTIVVFLVLLFILARFAWKPMLQGLEKREHDIQAAVSDARTVREEATRLREDVQAERNKIEDMRRDILQKAQADAQRTADEIMARAKADMQAERDRLRRDMETARDQAVQDLWRQTADLAALVSTKVIRRQMTAEDHRRFVDEALADIRQAGNGQRTTAGV